MSHLSLRLVGGTVLAGLLAGACSGGDNSAAVTAAATTAAPGKCPASAGLGPSVNDHGSRQAAAPAISIEAGDSFFAPTCLTGVAAGKVSVTVKNTGAALHNFSIEGQAIDVDVAPGKSVTVDVDVSSAPLPFVCKYHRTSGMVGALLQQPG